MMGQNNLHASDYKIHFVRRAGVSTCLASNENGAKLKSHRKNAILQWSLTGWVHSYSECVKSKLKLFADDSLLYRRIKNIADCHQLQEDLNKLQEWEQRWQIDFNADKCEVIHITKKEAHLLRLQHRQPEFEHND